MYTGKRAGKELLSIKRSFPASIVCSMAMSPIDETVMDLPFSTAINRTTGRSERLIIKEKESLIIELCLVKIKDSYCKS
jgi:hypothetical protein